MKKCKYCDIKNYHEDDNGKLVLRISVRDKEDDCMVFLTMEYDKNDNTWFCIPVGEYRDFSEIDRCPFCGRKLNDEV